MNSSNVDLLCTGNEGMSSYLLHSNNCHNSDGEVLESLLQKIHVSDLQYNKTLLEPGKRTSDSQASSGGR